MDEVRLSIPADPDNLHLLRIVVSNAASRGDWTLDAIDDLRLAVDEAGAYLLAIKSPISKLTMSVRIQEEVVTVVVSSDAVTGSWPPTGFENSLAWKVLSGLSDKAEFFIQEGSPAIRLIKDMQVSVET